MHPPVYCSSCGKPNAPDTSFCNGCAKPMIQAPQMQPARQTPIKKSSNLSTFVILGVFCLLMFWFIRWSYQNNFGAMRQSINSFMGWKDAPTQPQPPPRSVTPAKHTCPYTIEKYSQITIGMKQEDVETLLGSKGKQSYDSSDKKDSLTMYDYYDPDATTACRVSISFINKKVHDKSQFGLE